MLNTPPADTTHTADSADSAAARLAAVKRRIREACEAVGRPADSVSLLAVSKTWEASRVRELAALGQLAFGENYLQEALAKIADCAAAQSATAGPVPLQWHFIGPIQSNKTRPIAEHFHWVHSIEREKIAARLSEQRPDSLPPLQVCVQVNVSGEASKSGCAPEEAVALALAVARLPRLHLRGLMTIPEPTDDMAQQCARFAALRGLFEEISSALSGQDRQAADRFDTLSMGMSDDLEAAIAEGATIVRVGTALFGRRPVAIRPLP
jgi:pyridoxal phosphate enzyme (YggS family)